MINFKNKEETILFLKDLDPKTPPLFGIMTPQHMVEHLTTLVKISSGKIKMKLYKSEETAAKWKQGLIYTDIPFPKGFKAPLLPEGSLIELKNSDLNAAIQELSNEIDEFNNFYLNHPEDEIIHPTLGLLNRNEWEIFHSKHFTHHYEQFGL